MTTKKLKKLSNLEIIKIYKALADKTRFGIALNLHTSRKELTCSELAERFDLSQPAFSHHCKKLSEAGILNTRTEGATHFLSLNHKVLIDAGINLDRLW
jgi:DNA-binding transcriptional ArsR family regulator